MNGDGDEVELAVNRPIEVKAVLKGGIEREGARKGFKIGRGPQLTKFAGKAQAVDVTGDVKPGGASLGQRTGEVF